jgi:hypothetical protein
MDGGKRDSKPMKATPMVVSTHNKNYLLPAECRGKHKFEDAMAHVSFLSEPEGRPYFPFPFYPKMCVKCLEWLRPQ